MVKFKSLITVVCLTLLYGIYYWGIPAVINLSGKTDLIQNIAKKHGVNISITNPDLKMGLNPSVIIKAEDFAILNDDNSKALEIQKPYIEIAILPLILKKTDIKEFRADNVNAEIVYDRELMLGQYPINFDAKQPLKLQHAKIKLDGYKIKMQDKAHDKEIILDGQYFAIDRFNPDKELKLSILAELSTGAKINADIDTKLPLNKISDDNIKIDGHIINLNLEDFTPYAKVFSKDKIQKLSGTINAAAKTEISENNHKQIKIYSDLNNIGVFPQDTSASIYSNEKLTVTSSLNILKNGLNIEQMNLSGDKINISISGTIDKLTSKLPKLNLTLKINDTRCENIIPLLPGEEHLVPEINLLKLKQTVFQGDVNGAVTIEGKADYPDITGQINITDAFLVKPIFNAPKATINMEFKGKKLLLDTHVPTTQTQYVDVKGPIELYPPRYADLQITSTDSIDFITAQTVLNPLHEILTFQIGPVPIMKLQGNGNINLHVKGTKQIPHGWGKFTFKNTTASFNDINNLTLKNGYGELIFDDENTYFKTSSATLNSKPVTVEGTCTLQGALDFNITSGKQDIHNLLTVIKTSPMLSDIQKMLAPIEDASGLANVKLNVTGKVKDPKDIVFNKNIFAKGLIDLYSNNIKFHDMPVRITNVSGKAEFENNKVNFNLLSSINTSKIKISGFIKENLANVQIFSDKFALSDAIAVMPEMKLPYKEDFEKIHLNFTAKYSGILNPINYNNITLKGKIYQSSGAAMSVNGGNFELNNGIFKFSQLTGLLKGSPYTISAAITNTFAQNPKINGDFKLQNFNLSLLNDNTIREFLPQNAVEILNNLSDFNGSINLSGKIQNNNMRIFTKLNDISLTYIPSHLKLQISGGNLFLNNNTLHIDKMNSRLGEMPILADGKISGIFSRKPELNLYINTKPSQEFFDQFFNNKAVYPIKLKGDVSLTTRITGAFDNLRIKSNLKLEENSSLYYMGASIGDSQNPVNIDIDSNITPKGITLNRLQYDKVTVSQDNKTLVTPQLAVSGAITYLPDNNAAFKNLRIQTKSPTDAKIFNIIFRKPIMKQGIFTSNLLLNGTALAPEILGKFDITSIDIPFFDSTVKDINLEFTPDKIFIKSRGVVLTNNIILEAAAQNNFTPPYIIENIKLKLADLDINKLMRTLRDIEADISRNKTSAISGMPNYFDINQLILQNADITADTISVRNIHAQDFTAKLNLNEKMLFDVNDFKFKIAEGTVKGDFNYNLLTHAVKLNLNLDKANAQMMTEALFDLKGQIYGSMTGNASLLCNGTSYERCMQTLSGEGEFMVSDGKMPKLGSLEYLLKAGNLIRSGFTGLSINSLIDFITPLKTGEFNSISGQIKIADGIITPINIYSDGKDLNIYMTGSYNIVSSLADMRVFGSLSKNITGVLGKIKNASLNTLFNTIPGINRADTPQEFQAEIEKIPNTENGSVSRLFNAEIYGDINGDNYVKSFRWIK